MNMEAGRCKMILLLRAALDAIEVIRRRNHSRAACLHPVRAWTNENGILERRSAGGLRIHEHLRSPAAAR